jgi:hypothetical protein
MPYGGTGYPLPARQPDPPARQLPAAGHDIAVTGPGVPDTGSARLPTPSFPLTTNAPTSPRSGPANPPAAQSPAAAGHAMASTAAARRAISPRQAGHRGDPDAHRGLAELLQAASPEEAAWMLAGLPSLIRIIWRLFGHRKPPARQGC